MHPGRKVVEEDGRRKAESGGHRKRWSRRKTSIMQRGREIDLNGGETETRRRRRERETIFKEKRMEGEEKERKFFQRRQSCNEPQKQNPWKKRSSLTLLYFFLSACFSLPLFPPLCISLCLPLWWVTPSSFHPLNCPCQYHFLSPFFCPPLFLLTNAYLSFRLNFTSLLICFSTLLLSLVSFICHKV